MSDNRPRDPRLDPRNDPAGIDPLIPGAPPPGGEPEDIDRPYARSRGGSGIILAAVVAALLVIGFIAFTGQGVDPETTATVPGPATTDETAPPAAAPEPAEPAPSQQTEPPAADQPVTPAPTPQQ